MKILNVKMSSASCNFKTSKMKSRTKTNLSCQIVTSSNPPIRNPSGNKVDNTNNLKHLEQINDPENHKKFKETLHQSKNIRFV